jgi:hypothetical protein
MKSFRQYLNEEVQFDKYEPATYNKIEDKPNKFTYHNYSHDDGTEILIQHNHQTGSHHVSVQSRGETKRKGAKGKHAIRKALEFRDRTAQTMVRHDSTHRPNSYHFTTSTGENKKKWANRNSKVNMFGRIMKSVSKHTNQKFKTTEKAQDSASVLVKHTRVTKK